MKKFALSAVTAAALGMTAFGASAQVNIDASPAAPASVAREIIATVGSPVVLANVTNQLDIVVALGYSFSANEIRYVRVELANGVFTTASVASSVGTAGIGAVNGVGTSVIFFSLTAGNDADLIAASTLTINGTRSITGTASNMTVSYSLYDQPSQAQAGGGTGRIMSKLDRAYINFNASQTLVVTPDPTVSIATVAVAPAFTTFVAAGNTTTATARLAGLDYRLVTAVPMTAAGAAITLANLNATGAAGTRIVVTGDFSAAANVDGTFTGAALPRVYLSTNMNCTNVAALNAAAITGSSATFNVGATTTTPNMNLCYTPRNPSSIPASMYTAGLTAVSAAPAVYTATSVAPMAAGEIRRDGTVLQMPLAQTTPGYVSRFILTNTSSTAAAYTTRLMTEAGVTAVAGAAATGMIPAMGSVTIVASDLMTITGIAMRATVEFTVAQNSNQIQGQYQVVNMTTGAVSNTVMVRPGTN